MCVCARLGGDGGCAAVTPLALQHASAHCPCLPAVCPAHTPEHKCEQDKEELLKEELLKELLSPHALPPPPATSPHLTPPMHPYTHPWQDSEEELLKERDCVGHLIPGAQRAVCAITEDTMLPGEAAALMVWGLQSVSLPPKKASASIEFTLLLGVALHSVVLMPDA